MSAAGDDVARAVVLLDHGSREADANAQLDELAMLVAARLPGRRVVVAHLELAPPTLGDAAASCIRAGAREVVVAPCFLAPGRHVREDLPRLVAELGRAHPAVSFRLAQPIGAHPGVADALAKRAEEASGARR